MNAHHKRRRTTPFIPEPKQQITTGLIGEFAQKARIYKAIARIPFFRQLHLALSNAQLDHPLSTSVQQLVKTSGSSDHVMSFNLAQLLDLDFLASYIRKGSLVALSQAEEDSEDVICIDGRGRLVLALEKDTYELLGLEGRPSRFGSPRQKYIVEINLLKPSFRAGKAGFERIKEKLANWPESTSIFHQLSGPSAPSSSAGRGRKFDMDFVWVDEDGMKGEIKFPAGLSASRHEASTRTSFVPPLPLPPTVRYHPAPKQSPKSKRRKIPTESDDEVEKWLDSMLRVREWGAMVSLRDGDEDEQDDEEGEVEEGGSASDAGDDETSTGGCRVLGLGFNGFFHPALCKQILDLITASSFPGPLIAFNAHPPPNSPLSHLSARPPLVGTRKKRNGKTVRRGRGRGEEEEGCGVEIGFEITLYDPAATLVEETGEQGTVVQRREGKEMQWAVWEER